MKDEITEFESKRLAPLLYNLSHKCKEHNGKKQKIELSIGLKKELCFSCLLQWNNRMASLAEIFFKSETP